ncbi:MAG: hypothetical protein ISS36_01520 [Candidatus Aenigmarchaeota archaeon]|nr:hypothetical protein [Candidatus Aenigmarchaeota archaeon]
MWSSRKGIYGIFFIVTIGVAMMFFFIAMHTIGLGNILTLSKTIMLSTELDERGSFLCTFMNSEKDGIKNMELLANLYIDSTLNTEFLEDMVDKIYGPYWQMKIQHSSGEIVLGREEIDDDAMGTTIDIPIPGAGKSGATKSKVVFKI